MKQIWQQAVLIGTATAIISSINLPAQAGVYWSGTGVITSGSGQGGTVSLSLTIDGSNVKFHSGPSEGETKTISNGVAYSNAGVWEFENCGSDLCINFEQNSPSRTIYYRLN